ncbi:DUF952 domain-containing protein [Pelolinea submarina]|uniref:Uncharacterized protein (DUF952 family) n=1 Tax=Pelolinea submarina TaxID=913107 RepID=A0A347ZVG0_9CHLR|nr:DUF952 domain-containing protein [Pelolinea submarina]REG06988.1 uncharacterized protein (DUF952 family) [Pelolinea submarina]BBB49291.1 hypothetical protein Pelsub_P2522 [Pelolinea submarina]
MIILHITDKASWAKAQQEGIYRGDSLEREGFIHCCQAFQVDQVLTDWFKDTTDLLILEIDTDALQAELVNENLEGGKDLFPHIYGPLNLEAVVTAREVTSQ